MRWNDSLIELRWSCPRSKNLFVTIRSHPRPGWYVSQVRVECFSGDPALCQCKGPCNRTLSLQRPMSSRNFCGEAPSVWGVPSCLAAQADNFMYRIGRLHSIIFKISRLLNVTMLQNTIFAFDQRSTRGLRSHLAHDVIRYDAYCPQNLCCIRTK